MCLLTAGLYCGLRETGLLFSGQNSFTGKLLNSRMTPSVQLRLSVTLLSSLVSFSKTLFSVISSSFSATRSLRFVFCSLITELTVVRRRRRRHISQSVNQSVHFVLSETDFLPTVTFMLSILVPCHSLT